MKRVTVYFLALFAAASVPAAAAGGRGHGSITITEIGGFSAQASPNHAVAGAHLRGRRARPGQTDTPTPTVEATRPSESPVPLPTLASDSPLLRNPHPMGPGTLWYQGPPGQHCVYAPSTSPLCFAVVQPSGAPLDPGLVASQVAQTMDLALPPIEASPAADRRGLTGDRSWFRLAAAPSRAALTIRLGAEVVAVTADPSETAWSFGDGGRGGGAGVAYRPGPPPPDAVTHVYEARCLPGDAGRNPHVASSCESDGYHVLARVTWTISFAATGPVTGSGALPARTTQSELVYPVSEARAFLVGGSS